MAKSRNPPGMQNSDEKLMSGRVRPLIPDGKPIEASPVGSNLHSGDRGLAGRRIL